MENIVTVQTSRNCYGNAHKMPKNAFRYTQVPQSFQGGINNDFKPYKSSIKACSSKI